MDHISGGASGFVFEDQPPDAFEFQFGKIVQFIFFLLHCILHFLPLLTILHLTFQWSTPWIDVKALTLLVLKAELGCPNPILTLPIHLWYFCHTVSFLFFLFCSLKVFLPMNLPLVKTITQLER